MLARLVIPRRVLVFGNGAFQARISTTSTPALEKNTSSSWKRTITMSSHYDAIVIGSGQAGGPLAQAYAKAGRRTALIESTHVGGQLNLFRHGC
jgi:alkyl hydroperoxide reductase subunit AhpF